ncbi:hypothetical protein [Microlunatus sp. GCM10028923]|uniref:hypothetical protein n=1 Tax=Microlunatus sp. GCM10028923 TaxID=3273400 RepID=UPI003605E7B3
MGELTEHQLRRAAQDLMGHVIGKGGVADTVSAPDPAVAHHARESQNALRAAVESTDSAIWLGSIVNRLLKVAEGKAVRGRWSMPAQDNLRAAVLFAGAGLDRALKRLVEESLGRLVAVDDMTVAKLETFATQSITDRSTGAVNPAQVVALFLSAGETPREVLTSRWIRSLTDGSAQSSERVTEIASALGVTDPDLRKRIAPQAKKTLLEQAFLTRNEIAHELDVTKPQAEVRQPLERIRRARSITDVQTYCQELLDVTQMIINDVSRRLKPADG